MVSAGEFSEVAIYSSRYKEYHNEHIKEGVRCHVRSLQHYCRFQSCEYTRCSVHLSGKIHDDSTNLAALGLYDEHVLSLGLIH
jgi:hypothetical protein